jgi:hypothetical protein
VYYCAIVLITCCVLFYLPFRLLRLCVTFTNLRDDKGEKNVMQKSVKGGIDPPMSLMNSVPYGIEPWWLKMCRCIKLGNVKGLVRNRTVLGVKCRLILWKANSNGLKMLYR